MESVYLITMWSGGKASKKWKSAERPEPLSQGTGVRFTNLETKLTVEIIGSISVEEFELGSIQLEEESKLEGSDDQSDEKPDEQADEKPWKPPFEF